MARRIYYYLKVGDLFETKRSGTFEVIEKNKRTNIVVKSTTTGKTVTVTWEILRHGRINDFDYPRVCGVGFISKGDYDSNSRVGDRLIYSIWSGMLFRCYVDGGAKYYKDCTVCEEWHNYQNFAKWYDENYPLDGTYYELDKDVKVKGNRVYSPEACTFLTSEENTACCRQKDYKFINPQGEVVELTNLNKFCRDNNLTQTNMSAVNAGKNKHHKGWTKYIEDLQ